MLGWWGWRGDTSRLLMLEGGQKNARLVGMEGGHLKAGHVGGGAEKC